MRKRSHPVFLWVGITLFVVGLALTIWWVSSLPAKTTSKAIQTVVSAVRPLDVQELLDSVLRSLDKIASTSAGVGGALMIWLNYKERKASLAADTSRPPRKRTPRNR